MMRSPWRCLLRSHVRFFGTTAVATASLPSVWSNETITGFDNGYKEQSVQKLGDYSSVMNTNYGYSEYCKLVLFRNMHIVQQQHDGLHEMVETSSQENRVR